MSAPTTSIQSFSLPFIHPVAWRKTILRRLTKSDIRGDVLDIVRSRHIVSYAIFADRRQAGMWSSAKNFDSVSMIMTTVIHVEATRVKFRNGIYFRATYNDYTSCNSMGSDLFGQTITSSHLSFHYNSYVHCILKPIVLHILWSPSGAFYQRNNAHLHTVITYQ